MIIHSRLFVISDIYTLIQQLDCTRTYVTYGVDPYSIGFYNTGSFVKCYFDIEGIVGPLG